jgi:hypothetical protein
MAGEQEQPLRLPGMHPPEGWSGEGRKQPRMPDHRLGDTLAASEAGGQELELIGLVGGRAGGADRHPAVAAALEEGGVRLPVGRIHPTDLAGLLVGLFDLTAEAYRVSAVAGLGDLLHSAVIARTGPSDGLGYHLR